MRKLFILALYVMMLAGLCAERIEINDDQFEVNVWADGPDRTEIVCQFGAFDREAVEIDGETWYWLSLPGECRIRERGAPALPRITRSLAIGDDAYMEVRFLGGEYTDMPMNIAPSKGVIMRNVDPETVPYAFGEPYAENAFYPEMHGDRDAPYIMRDIRGIATHLYPFQYNPVSGVLRVWHSMRFEVVRTGVDTKNVKITPRVNLNRHFFDVYSQRFANLQPTRYDTLSAAGDILVIAPSNFMDEMQPWVDWKTQEGFRVTVTDVADFGGSAYTMKTYVQEQYDDPNMNLTFLLLVGDAAQVPTLTASGGGSDPSFALLEGNDSYPDIFVGRFSAETENQLETQVERSIYYERDIDDQDAEWLHKGLGVASSQGSTQGHGDPREPDYVHMRYISEDLLDFTYTQVDSVYDTFGGNASMVANAINDGRSIVNYCGHGSTTSWFSSGFNVSHVSALTNDYKLPHIISVACVNGNFVYNTCFAEAWMRAVNNTTGVPTGAIAIYASSINQSWAPPMDAQDEITDLLVGGFKTTTGGLYYNGSCKMIDLNGAEGLRMFKTWHIFGDPTLQVRSDVPTAFSVNHMPAIFLGLDTFEVDAGMEGAHVCLSFDGVILGAGYTEDDGAVTLQLDNMPSQPEDLTLTITGFNKITYVNTVPLTPNTGAYVLVREPDYTDNDNDIPEFGDQIVISINVENIGVESAYNATASLATLDEYIECIDNTEEIGQIDATSTRSLGNAFEIALASNIPDQHEVELTIEVNAEDASGNPLSWSRSFSFTAYAPALAIQSYEILDGSGNNNGQLDPGETVAIEFDVVNNGSCVSPAATGTLVCNNPHLDISSGSFSLGQLTPGVASQPIFVVTLSEDVAENEIVPIGFGVEADGYFAQTSILYGAPALIEDFESGLNSMAWTFGGDADWDLYEDEAFEGTYSLRSGVIGAAQSTTAGFTYNVTISGEMVFYRNISSEVNHDYLRFYVDGEQMGQWSGDGQWEPVAVEIEAGEHTFTWTYSKDANTDFGDDCTWIDFISFPGNEPQPAPIIALSSEILDFSDIALNEVGTAQITAFNYGNETLAGSATAPTGFYFDTLAGALTSVDYALPPQSNLTYTLVFEPTELVDYDGVLTFASNDPFAPQKEVELETSIVNVNPDIPAFTRLSGNYPNPFNPETTVEFSLAASQDVELTVYNIRGQLVKTLVDERLEAGEHSIVWSGESSNGRQVGSGVYFLKMRSGRYTSTKKMILLK